MKALFSKFGPGRWEWVAAVLAAVPAVLCVGAEVRAAVGPPCRGTLANYIDCPKATGTAACGTYAANDCVTHTYTKTWSDWFGCTTDQTNKNYCYPEVNPDGSSITDVCARTYGCILDQAKVTCIQGNQVGNTIVSAVYDDDPCS